MSMRDWPYYCMYEPIRAFLPPKLLFWVASRFKRQSPSKWPHAHTKSYSNGNLIKSQIQVTTHFPISTRSCPLPRSPLSSNPKSKPLLTFPILQDPLSPSHNFTTVPQLLSITSLQSPNFSIQHTPFHLHATQPHPSPIPYYLEQE